MSYITSLGARIGRFRLLALVALVTGIASAVASPAVAASGPPADAVDALERASTEPVTVQIDHGLPRFVSARVPVEGADAAERAYACLERFADLYGLDEPRSELRLDGYGGDRSAPPRLLPWHFRGNRSRTHGNDFRQFQGFWLPSQLPAVAVGCDRWARQALHRRL